LMSASQYCAFSSPDLAFDEICAMSFCVRALSRSEVARRCWVEAGSGFRAGNDAAKVTEAIRVSR